MSTLDFPYRNLEEMLSIGDDDPSSPYYVPPQQPMPQPHQPRSYGYADRLAMILGNSDIPATNALTGALRGFSRGFSGHRLKKISDQERNDQALDVRAMEQDRRNFEVTQAAKRLRAVRTEKARELIAADNRERAKVKSLDQLFQENKAEAAGTRAGAPLAPRDERVVQIMGKDGKPVWVRESDAVGQPAAQAARAVTGREREILGYYQRGQVGLDNINSADKNGTTVEDRIAQQNTVGQLQGQFAPNLVQTPDQQKYRQAQRAFTEARLRRESGAAIPQNEYDNDARTYFFQPGDTPETMAQKRAARLAVLEGAKFAAGKAYEEFYGEPATYTTRGASSAAPASAPAPNVSADKPAGGWFQQNAPGRP